MVKVVKGFERTLLAQRKTRQLQLAKSKLDIFTVNAFTYIERGAVVQDYLT